MIAIDTEAKKETVRFCFSHEWKEAGSIGDFIYAFSGIETDVDWFGGYPSDISIGAEAIIAFNPGYESTKYGTLFIYDRKMVEAAVAEIRLLAKTDPHKHFFDEGMDALGACRISVDALTINK